MNVEFKASFAKDLRVIKDQNLLARVKETVVAAEQAKVIEDIPALKKLKGESRYYRIRVGD